MDDAPTTPATPAPGGRRGLDRRTIAICVCVALIGAFAAALVTSFVVDDDGPTASESDGTLTLQSPEDAAAGVLATALETRDGQPTDLAALIDDRPVLVNLWQSSCPPCIDEMPLLEQASETNDDVAVIGVATQEVRTEAAERLAAQTGVTYPWVLDPVGDLYYALQGSGMPTTVVLDTDGTVLAREIGAFADLAEVQAFIDGALEAR